MLTFTVVCVETGVHAAVRHDAGRGIGAGVGDDGDALVYLGGGGSEAEGAAVQGGGALGVPLEPPVRLAYVLLVVLAVFCLLQARECFFVRML